MNREDLLRFIRTHFGEEVDSFGYDPEEWADALMALMTIAPEQSLDRLVGYIACCAEAGERTGRLLPLEDEVLRHHSEFGMEG